jgi:DNA gyrase/topoisomerase IV subunit A
VKADDLRSCLESKDNDPEALYSLKNTLQEETKDELDQLQTRSADCEEILEDLEEKLKSHKQKLSAAKSKLKEDMGR